MPTTVLLPEFHIPKWASVYLPTIVTLLHVVGTPTKSIHLVGFWALFENVMSLQRTKAMLMGLLEFGRVNEWVVTAMLSGSTSLMRKCRTCINLPNLRRNHVLIP
ncbi:unnamed protein product [Linum trigynum]|uniref:Uncharacterized protein n=1 Tax=Linum trigynum TaxID=586398 RepID=A0AAV2EBK3_9ROSI